VMWGDHTIGALAGGHGRAGVAPLFDHLIRALEE
jgi:hypothetical protein